MELGAVLVAIVAVGVIVGILLQRLAEAMLGNRRTTIGELMLYTFLVALLCYLLLFISDAASTGGDGVAPVAS
jgi:hypothetical protein